MAFGDNLLALFLEAVAGVFQKDQAQNDVLVLGGLDGAAQFVGGFPKSLLHADRFFRSRCSCHVVLHPRLQDYSRKGIPLQALACL